MHLAYLSMTRLPSEKASGYQSMRVCGALARLGHVVTLFVPKRRNHLSEDPFLYYGLEKNFSIVEVPVFDAMRLVRILGPLAFRLTMYFFAQKLSLPRETIVYTREHYLVRHFVRRGYRVFYNAHTWERTRAAFLKGAAGVVCNSVGTKEAVERGIQLPIIVAPNASDVNKYVGEDVASLRANLGLPPQAIALYAGHLFSWKGSEILREAARLLPGVQFVLVGGTDEDVNRVRRGMSENMIVLGHTRRQEIPKYLAAADVLLLPNTATSEESARHTSPIKLFEYLAAGKPIVASDLLSLRSVVSEKEVFFVRPDDPASLAKGIEMALHDTAGARARATAALLLSKSYTWETHAAKVAALFERSATTTDR
jgi:glycosyltransferase involved in cell wall biosynthesis